MNPAWQQFLAQWPGYAPDGQDFGSPEAELDAAGSGAIVVPLADTGLIGLDGPDSAAFLHALATNDVEHLDDHTVRFAGVCSAKGRLLASFHVWRRSEGLAMMVAADVQAALTKKLSMYVLRSKVRLFDLGADRALLGVGGPEAGAVVARLFGAIPEIRQTLAVGRGWVVRIDCSRFVLDLDVGDATGLWPKLAEAARPAGLAAWRWLEIGAGQPRVVAATQEAFVPQMLNMEVAEVGGLVFTKGCYPGQEVVARTQYLGKIKRRMFRGAIDVPVAPGADVFTPESAGQHCGAVVSAAPSPAGGYEALFVVQSSGAEAGEIHVGTPDGPRLRLLDLPYSVA